MAATTSRLSLTKPGGGSTGLITPPDPVDIDVLNANFDKIDAVMGLQVVTSVTRPASPFDGQPIFETDTKRIRVYRQSGATWDTGDTQRGTRTAYSVADLTALDLIADAIVGDTAYVTAPGTGIDPFMATAYNGTGATIEWRLPDLVAASKANLDTFIAAVAALSGTDVLFVSGRSAYTTDTKVRYLYNGTTWKAWDSDPIAFTPTWTNLVVGTGGSAANAATYRYRAGIVKVKGKVVLGTTGSSVTGIPIFTLPVACEALWFPTDNFPGLATLRDEAVATYIAAVASGISSTTTARIVMFGTNGVHGAISATSPFTWAAADGIGYEFEYVPA